LFSAWFFCGISSFLFWLLFSKKFQNMHNFYPHRVDICLSFTYFRIEPILFLTPSFFYAFLVYIKNKKIQLV